MSVYTDPPDDWSNPRKLTEPSVIALLPDHMSRHFRQIDREGYPRWMSTSTSGITDTVLAEILSTLVEIRKAIKGA